MKRFSHYVVIFLMALTSCYTDEPPSVRSELIGEWELVDLQGATYEEVPNTEDLTYEKRIIHEEPLNTYNEGFLFDYSGAYAVNYHSDAFQNEMQAFVFTSGNQNIPLTPGNSVVFGIWEEYINSNIDYIVHFDQRLVRQDVFMIVKDVSADSLILQMDLNSYNTQNGNAILRPTAQYHGIREGYFYSFLAPDTYLNGYNLGVRKGFYEGFLSVDKDLENHFITVYGESYVQFFEQAESTKIRQTPNIDVGFDEGYSEWFLIGQQLANQTSEEFNKGFTLTYKFVRK